MNITDVKKKIVNGKTVTTFCAQFASANILEVEVGTTGFRGGDTGHGARTYFKLENLGGTDMTVSVTDNGVIIELGGDTEITTFVDALEFAVNIIKYKIGYEEED